MYVSLSIVQPNPGHEGDTEASMGRFATAARAQPGLVLCSTFRETDSSDLFGIAVWESEQAAAAAGPAVGAAVKDDDFATWVGEMKNYRLVELAPS